MRLFTTLVGALMALSLAGCCCPDEPAAGLAILAKATPSPARQFLVVRATVLELQDDGEKQILLESCVVSVPGEGRIEALQLARRLDEPDVPVWLSAGQAPEATFGAPSEVISKPSIVTRSGEEGTIQVGEGGGGIVTLSELSVVPTVREGGVDLRLAYTHHDHGTLVRTIPEVTLRGPERRVFIIEALPPR